MKKKLIFGCSALARRLFQNLKSEGYTTDAFVVDDNYCNQDQFCDVPLIPYSKMEELFPVTEYEAYVTIGYTGMNSKRKDVIERLLALGYSLPNYIHHSVICDSVTMGSGNLFFPGSIMEDIKIGNGNIFLTGVLISHDAKIGSYNFFASRTTFSGNISTGNQNFFGLNCSIKDGVKIGNRCFIGASAYVSQNLKDGNVLVPARSMLLEKDSSDIIRSMVNK